MPLSRYQTALSPDDLEMLSRVLKQACAEMNIPPTDEAVDEFGAQLVMLFQRGMTDESELRTALRPDRPSLSLRKM